MMAEDGRRLFGASRRRRGGRCSTSSTQSMRMRPGFPSKHLGITLPRRSISMPHTLLLRAAPPGPQACHGEWARRTLSVWSILPCTCRYVTNLPISLEQMLSIDEDVVRGGCSAAGTVFSGGKSCLRQAMAHLLPEQPMERRKQGFSSPEASWYLRGEQRALRARELAKTRIQPQLHAGFIVRYR